MAEVTTQNQREVPVEAIGAIVSKLYEIWHVEGKRHSNLEGVHVVYRSSSFAIYQ